MASLSEEELRRIVEAQRPGYTLAQKPSVTDAVSRAPADAHTPDLETLARKYFGRAAPPHGNPGNNPSNPNDAGGAPADSAIVLIEPRDPLDHHDGAGPKAVVISPEGQIIAEQG